jgi:hypothetical protein
MFCTSNCIFYVDILVFFGYFSKNWAFFQSSGHPVSDDAMKPGEKEMKKETLDSKKPTVVNAEPEPEPESEPEPVTGIS